MNMRCKTVFFSALLGLAAAAVAQTVTLSVAKIWDDAADQDGIRPEFLRLTLTADGVDKESATISAATGWAVAWKNLPALDGGKTIEYDVREDVVPSGYSISSVMRSGGGGGDVSVTITDTHVPAVTTISAQKIWDDANDQDGKRPATLVLSLYADGAKQTDATLSEANGWAASWKDVPVCGGGLPIAYEVREDAVPEGYSLVSVESDGHAWTFTDRHGPATATVSIAKIWDDAADQDGLRPAELRLTLMADGVAKGSATLSDATGWAASWEGLPAFDAGKAIEYDVREDIVPPGYAISSVARSGGAGGDVSVTITDTHVPAGPPELKAAAAWTLDRSTGLIGGTLVLSNGGESPIGPDFDYWLATPGSRPEWHLWDSTGRMPDAADWFDLTAAVRAALAQTGNHDAAFDPGESVAVAAPRVYHRRRVSPAQYLDVQAAVHAGRLFHVSDSDRDFVLSDAELVAAQAAWSAGKLTDADLLEATRLHGGAAYLWDDALQNWDTLAVDLR